MLYRTGRSDLRHFLHRTVRIAVPIMIQTGITSFVGMLDNIMVGRIGTDAMSGVAIVNQLLFVLYLCIYGGLSGIGIFTAQFYGKLDHRGIRYTFRAKVMLGVLLTALGIGVLALFGPKLIGAFLHEGGSAGSLEETLLQARRYLRWMMPGLLPMALTAVYSTTLRETSETVVPMKASLCAVLVNLCGNYILIYGNLGAPALGVTGAAVATVLSRFTELAYVALWTHRHTERNAFIRGVYSSFHVPADLLRNFAVKGLPLMLNETLWSSAQTMLNQCYSMRGLSVVAAVNIATTLSNVFGIAFIAMGSATAVLLGQELGAGHLDTVKRDSHRLTVFTLVLCVASGALLILVSPLFPRIYNTTDEVRALAARLMVIYAVFMPLYGYENVAYFTIRSGGNTLITLLFDAVFCWAVSVPLALFLSRGTGMPAQTMYLLVQCAELIKCVVGFFLVRSGRWIRDLTVYSETGS